VSGKAKAAPVRLGCASCLPPNPWAEEYGWQAGWQPAPELREPGQVVPWRPCVCNPRREAWERGDMTPVTQRPRETPYDRVAEARQERADLR